MTVPMSAAIKGMGSAHMRESIHCAVVVKPSPAEKHKRAMLRYFVVAIALVAVFLLIAIALYYTQGSVGRLVHASALAIDPAGFVRRT